MNFTITIEDSSDRKNKSFHPRGHSDWVNVKDELKKFIKKELKLTNKELNDLKILCRECNNITGTVLIKGIILSNSSDARDKLLKKIHNKKI